MQREKKGFVGLCCPLLSKRKEIQKLFLTEKVKSWKKIIEILKKKYKKEKKISKKSSF
jgi:predicted nucleotidyltransferase